MLLIEKSIQTLGFVYTHKILFMNRFAAFGAGETTSLRIYRRDANINDRNVDEQADPHDDEGNSATVKPFFI